MRGARDLYVVVALSTLSLVLLVGGTLITRADSLATEVELAGYSTSLAARSPSQKHNARLSAKALNAMVVAPGETFSFNRTVRSWTVDRGYVKAPVSYDGELVRAFGGGVCQTSTTLYNAVLLAGLPIVERHAHVFAPSYVAPGRDAAVAQYDIDLRFRNSYPWPIHIQAGIVGDRLHVRVLGREKPSVAVDVTTDVLSTSAPGRVTYLIDGPAEMGGRRYLRSPGATGYRARAYRVFSADGRVLRRELLSDDSYQAMNRIVALAQARMP
ncbi:MAG: VanW family protein [Armatimonadota bacterium]